MIPLVRALDGGTGKIPAKKTLCDMYRAMRILRQVDGRATELAGEGRVAYYLSQRGWEGLTAGIAFSLREDDWLFPGPQVPDGGGLDASCGQPLQVVRASSPGGARLAHATGVGWAARLRGEKNVAVAVFGDTLIVPDSFHVALNFAGVHRASVVFVCRVDHEPVHCPTGSVADAGDSYGIPANRVDASDPVAVIQVMSSALRRARSGKGPTLIEAVKELDAIDPVVLLRAALDEREFWTEEDENALAVEWTERLEQKARLACAPVAKSEGSIDETGVFAAPSPQTSVPGSPA